MAGTKAPLDPTAELEIDETDSPEESDPETLEFEIGSYPADYTVKVLVEKWRDGQLVIPEFQREFVWTLPQASKLIESFLLGLPVPQVFLYKQRVDQKLLVVDGQQRLSSLVHFYDGKFPVGRTFRLSGVHERWQGKRYVDLDERDRLKLDDSPLRSIVVQQLRPNDNSSIYLIFERLNTGGTQLNPMEIRKTVFHGAPFKLVDELNRLPGWRSLLGMPNADKRLRDTELVLRVLALGAHWGSYAKPMKTFLTSYMEELSTMSEEQRKGVTAGFKNAVKAAVAGLVNRPFHVRGRLNVAALDSVVGGAIGAGVHDPGLLRTCYTRLLENEDYRSSIFFNTSDDSVVKARFKQVEDCLGPVN